MIVIVIGMHRSGTSAVAGTLHSNGISMGQLEDFYPPPQKENPKGFFENKRFRSINDIILRSFEYPPKHFNPKLPDYDLPIAAVIRLKMRTLISEHKDLPYWGWKDPRTCLTLRYWIEALDNVGIPRSDIKIVMVIRGIDDISDSMKRRGNKELLYKGQFRDLATAYYGRALTALADFDMPYYSVYFNELMRRKEVEIRELSKYIGVELPNSFVDPSISKGVTNG